MRWMVIAIGLAVASSANVRATVVIPASLTELVRDASSVAFGTVVATGVRWTEGRRGVETIVTLSAERYLKGGLGETMQFRVPGGRLGRYQTIMLGAPAFSVGQRVIVFLGGESHAIPHVLGLNQGVFRVVRAETGWIVTPPGPYTASASVRRVVRGDPGRGPMTLVEFEREVRALVAAGQ